MIAGTFQEIASQIIKRHPESHLSARWEEAVSFGKGAEAKTFWIRETDDAINLVWLNKDGIRDIAWSPANSECMFNYIPLRSIVTFEVREKKDIVLGLLGVKGDYTAHVIPQSAESGQLWWVAESEESKQRLRAFLSSVLTEFTRLR